MKKIISLFQRNYDGDHLVRDEVVPGAEWVLAGEGIATKKWDGTSCLVKNGELFKRYDAKHGKNPPEGFIPSQPSPDEKTGHWPGWLKIGEGKEDQWHRETFAKYTNLPNGTYELIGPKINSNREEVEEHMLIRHGHVHFEDCPRTFNEIKSWLENKNIEGIVWHHPDGRMVKIKKKDFGLMRKK